MANLPSWQSWTVQEASVQTGYKPEYIRRLIRKREIEAVKVGHTWLIMAASMKAYAKQAVGASDSRYGPKQQ